MSDATERVQALVRAACAVADGKSELGKRALEAGQLPQAAEHLRFALALSPDSLETLVQSGIMPERYLTDENFHPLICRREGEYFVVECTVTGGWKHRWLGLDARR